MTLYTLYHNPRCSKSRQTLALLEAQGITPHIVLYLNSPPSVATLKACLEALKMTPRQLLRNKEAIYKTLNLADTTLTDAQLLEAMSKHPKLIERPIVIKQAANTLRAVLGRPPENILQLME